MKHQISFKRIKHAIYDAILWISHLLHYWDSGCLCNYYAPDDAYHAKNDHAGRVLPLLLWSSKRAE
jgi:hypothetical protein